MKQPTKRKKKSKTPIYLLFGFLAFFAIFIWLITRTGDGITKKDLEAQLSTCLKPMEVDSVWKTYQTHLAKKSTKKETADFLLEIKKKLSSFSLSREDVEYCRKWLPPTPQSLNVVVIPDLSRRIVDTYNNPNQIENDSLVLDQVWQSFVEYAKNKEHSKDRLIIDITDIEQAQGQFSSIANNLQFDLSTSKEQNNRAYFSDAKNEQFNNNISQMYQLAKQKPLGADYVFYIRRYLEDHLEESTIYDTYINKVIIITDGYLEAQGRPADTKIIGYQKLLYPAVLNGTVLAVINNNQLEIPDLKVDLSEYASDVLICEVNERKAGMQYDFEILKTYWVDWFERMHTHQVEFIQRDLRTDLTAKKVREFILSK